jgi:hypothetical protein
VLTISVAFYPCGLIIDGTMDIVHVDSGKIIKSIPAGSEGRGLDHFSLVGCGEYVLVGTCDGKVRLFKFGLD